MNDGNKKSFAERFKKNNNPIIKKFAKNDKKDDFKKVQKGTGNDTKSEENKNQAFLAQKKRKDLLYLVKGKDKGQPAWHYVWVFPSKKRAFLEAVKTGSLDVSLYGEIKKSGWGEEPGKEIVNEIKKMYDIED
ncbi:hypothetical protein GUI12_02610 [Anaplasmataceae bacterium AB001_6]|nr:hypothetical protein GUI12_02610 [Anaplasmataceae bacterium AB001_6]